MKILDRWIKRIVLKTMSEPIEARVRDVEPAPEDLMKLARQAIETAVSNGRDYTIKQIEANIYHEEIFSSAQRSELISLINSLQRERKIANATVLFTQASLGVIEEPAKTTIGAQQAYAAQQYAQSVNAFRKSTLDQLELNPFANATQNYQK